ncbi:histidine ammonia-lyase [bacterium]|nr:histidine ammonia-lyase [bacterium]
MSTLILNGESLKIEQLGTLAEMRPAGIGERRVWVSPEARGKVLRGRQIIDQVAGSNTPHYGINTGFGPLCTKAISDEDLSTLQHNILVSHATGVGDRVPDPIVRLMLATKINSLLKGFSGVSWELIEVLVEFLNNDVLPHIPRQGSVGASGDLAPLAHMGLALLGLGKVSHRGHDRDAADVLRELKIAPVKLQPKEGLALLNGTQFMSSYGALSLFRAQRLLRLADINAGLSLEAIRGSIRPFDKRVQEVRPLPGQRRVAENIRRIMEESEILESHKDCSKVQDPYSLRCVPQVHGASRDAISYASRVIEIEINSATDNPLVFDNGDVISQGNFHGQPLALALDFAAMALAEIANISERRTYLLLEGRDGLPKLLMKDTGLNSGFMMPQYTAAALVSENKVLCHPASVDSIPTSLGQEDHVSMGSISATKLLRVLENSEAVLAIETMCACQGVDYRSPLSPGMGVAAALHRVRQDISHVEKDTLFAPLMETATRLVRSGAIVKAVEERVGDLN